MRPGRFISLVVMALGVPLWGAGCGEEITAAEAVDGIDDVAFVDGKLDGAISACEVEYVLRFVNDPGTDDQVLRLAGVHKRAAENIAAARAGADGEVGTADDEPFADVHALDAVPWVGPVALEQLRDAVKDSCQGTTAGRAEVIMSPQPYETSHVVRVAELIDAATRSVDVAMYSFRDAAAAEAIERAVERGVSVRLLFESARADKSDPDGTMSGRMEEIGVDVRYINKIMHHKFALIDGPRDDAAQAADAILVTGSANWSSSAATRFDENTVVLHGHREAALRFQREFNHLWDNSRDLVWNESLAWESSTPIDADQIVDEPGFDAVFTSANFDVKMSSTYGPTFSVRRGSNAAADRLVALIEGARSSILIASGHLRSRPIAEALIARHAADPTLDIRVYLDGQEYLSDYTHDEQNADLAICLEAAGSSEAKRQDCVDKGFLFARALDLEGIAVRFKYYAYRWHYSYAPQMHHKYLIVDGAMVASGSYNYSDNAEHNTMENVVFYDAAEFPELVAAFEANFEVLWQTQRAAGLYDALLAEVRDLEDESFPLVFEPMALGWSEVTELKRAIRDHCPDINSAEFRENPMSHKFCYR